MMSAADVVREGFAALMCLAGGALFVVAAIGVHRARDAYLRVHACKPAALYAVPLICAGLAVLAWDGAVALRLALLCAVLSSAAMMALQRAAAAAYASGAMPLSAEDLRRGEAQR